MCESLDDLMREYLRLSNMRTRLKKEADGRPVSRQHHEAGRDQVFLRDKIYIRIRDIKQGGVEET